MQFVVFALLIDKVAADGNDRYRDNGRWAEYKTHEGTALASGSS